MSYFAEVKNGIVQRVIVADQAFIDSGVMGNPANWVETKPDGSIRKNYAGIGHTFDAQLNAFVPEKPYTSWVLDANTARWKAPADMPKDGKIYQWNEQKQLWEIAG